MNTNQKYFLAAIGIILMIAFMFPPYQLVAGEGIKANGGFHWIFSMQDNIALVVNIGLLFMEWLFISSFGFIGYFSRIKNVCGVDSLFTITPEM